MTTQHDRTDDEAIRAFLTARWERQMMARDAASTAAAIQGSLGTGRATRPGPQHAIGVLVIVGLLLVAALAVLVGPGSRRSVVPPISEATATSPASSATTPVADPTKSIDPNRLTVPSMVAFPNTTPSAPQASIIPLVTGPATIPITSGNVRGTMVIPEGWSSLDRGFGAVKPLGTIDPPMVRLTTIDSVFKAPCRLKYMTWGSLDGLDAERLAATFQYVTGIVVAPPVPVTVDAWAGFKVDLTVPDSPECPEQIWLYGGAGRAAAGDHRVLLILDVEGSTVVLDSRDRPEHTARDRAEIAGILDSIRLEPVVPKRREPGPG